MNHLIWNPLPAPPLLSLFQMLLHSFSTPRFTPKTKYIFGNEYDFIVVGSGSAGSVVASRLSEKPCVTVLLLEAGKSPPVFTEVPIASSAFVGSDLDWKFVSTPQKHCASALVGRKVTIPSGKAVGGTSVINDMLNVRGNHHNYDSWAAMGAKGWSYDDVLPYFKKLEDNKVESPLDPGYHGFKGPMTISKPDYNPKLKELLEQSAIDEGYQFVDPNGQKQHGFYDPQGTLRDGKRCSTGKAYLVPSEDRPNLDILANAFVTKIDIQNNQAVGVLFHFNGMVHYVKAKKEVIVSAGAYNTPKLLMLSGVGPAQELNKFGIPVISDLPVGHNLQDHIGGFLLFELNHVIKPLLSEIINEKRFEQYIRNGTGVWSSFHAVDLLAFLNANKTEEADDMVNQEIYFVNVPAVFSLLRGLRPEIYATVFLPHVNKSLLMCMPQLIDPKSRGYVRLVSANPFQPPEIDPNYFEDPADSKVVVDGFKTCMKIANSPALSVLEPKLINLNYPECQNLMDDDDKFHDCGARAFPISSSHHTGTAKMGDPEDPTTVVDYELKVKTIKGLRVIDASVMPTIPWGNTNIPTIMIAEKGSDLIKRTITCN